MRRAVLLVALLFAAPSIARAQADLLVSNVGVGPPIAAVGTTVNVAATLVSSLPLTGNVDYRFYLSANAVLDFGDTAVLSSTTSFFGTTVMVTGSFVLPNTIAVGTYHLIAEVDHNQAYMETNESNNWSASASRIEVQGADLELVSWTVPSIAVIGAQYVLLPTIANSGIATATDFRYEYRLGTTVLHTSGLQTMAGSSQATFADPIVFSGPPGTITLTIVIDSGAVVPEDSEANNIAFSSPITLIESAPDLSVELVENDEPARPGDSFSATIRLKNTGIEDSGDFDYAYYLSDDPQITAGDRLLATFMHNIPAQREATATDALAVPEDLPAGNYYLGVIADPADALPELDETNNTAISASFRINEIPIRFATRDLPPALVGRGYATDIIVIATPRATLSMVSGALPDGLTFNAATGGITGAPTVPGAFTFRLRAANVLAFIEQEFTIDVFAWSPLEIATEMLPMGRVGSSYAVELLANGGTPPYAWSTTENAFPGRLALEEGGAVRGTPQSEGSFLVELVLTDGAGESVRKTLELVVLPRSAVAVTAPALPQALLGYSYCDGYVKKLEASGGFAPYTWIATTPMPPGMTLSSDGEVCGIPLQAGLFAFDVQAEDQNGDRGNARAILEVITGGKIEDSSGGGCSCSASERDDARGSAWMIVLMVLCAVRRRR